MKTPKLTRKVLRDHERLSFYSHWGEHATSAIRALYWLLRRVEE